MGADPGQDAQWQVYLLQCADQSLYAGVTSDLAKRVQQHNGELAGGARYTRARRPVALVWSEACDSRSDAQQREHALRRLSREQKLALIAGAGEGRYSVTVAPFWDWALSQYALEPTQALLLTLQSKAGLVILEALFAAWLSAEGHRLEHHDVAAMRDTTGAWLDDVVLPLRALREQWKGDATKVDARRHLLQLEVEAERHLAELMWVSTESLRNAPQDDMTREMLTAETAEHAAARMNANMLMLSGFEHGKFAPEREQLVALLLESK